MCIQGLVGVVMPYLDVVPIPAAPGVDGVGNGNGAVRSRKDGSTAWSADIGSVVVGNFPGEGIFPVAEARGNPCGDTGVCDRS